MARKTFFSFHFERDVWRAANVRSSDNIKDSDEIGFIDKADWEKVKAKGEAAIHKWIDDQIAGTTVTVVLIGAETSERDYVHYEITESWTKGNGLLGVYIHNIKDTASKTDTKGKNPFLKHTFTRGGKTVTIPVYDWKDDDGRENMADWIETAAKAAGH